MSQDFTTVAAAAAVFNQLLANNDLPVTGVTIHLEIAGATAMRLAGGNAEGLEERVPESAPQVAGGSLMQCQLHIIEQRPVLQELGMPDEHDFAIVLRQNDQAVVLSENVAAMIHGGIRGAWARNKGEELPTGGV